MTVNPFQQPYLASNDNRTIVGIDCPTCKSARTAVQFKSVPAQQAVKINVEPDLSFRPIELDYIPYGDPEQLPDELRGDSTVIYWRCESCNVVFHRAFDDLSPRALARHLYDIQFLKTLPQLQTELPQSLAKFLYGLFHKSIRDIQVLSCESELIPVSKVFATMGVTADVYAPLKPKRTEQQPNG